MTNQIDTLFHITGFDKLKIILKEGFKPSYASENLGERMILVPMISFSNILLRDVGENEVLNYGEYGIGFSRNWAIGKNINPVIYTYDKGEAQLALTNYLENSVFIRRLSAYKEHFKKWSESKKTKFSSEIALTNTSGEALALADFVSNNYNEELVESLSNFANSIFQVTKPIIFLVKPYQVANKNGDTFIAYNDREWRKTYLNLDFQVDDSEEYKKWIKKEKPHFSEEEYRLTFDVPDISAIMVKSSDEINEVLGILKERYPEPELKKLIDSKKLFIDSKENLIANGF